MTKLKGNLLFVDDEESILQALRRIFGSEEHQIYTALNGAEGIKQLETNPHIDIIISDMRMPEMDGATFLKIAAERWPNSKRILLTGYSDLNSTISAINEGKIDYYISKPWNNDQFINTINNLLENKHLKDQNKELQQILAKQNKELKQLNDHLEKKVKERTEQLNQSLNSLNETHNAAIQVFLSIKDLYEGNYKGYSRNVAFHAKLLAEALHLSEKEIQTIYLAALLHNLGKNGLTEGVMFKPFTRLTTVEYKEFIQHPIISDTVLSRFPVLKDVSNTILHHKERFDGTGYPYQLKGEAIPLFSRILALVVDFNELQYGLIFPESYHKKLAISYISDNAKKYDPELLPFFLNLIEDTSDDCIVVSQEALKPHQLKPGMVLSRDLVSNTGFTYLIKGYELTSSVIARIQELNPSLIYVVQDSPRIEGD